MAKKNRFVFNIGFNQMNPDHVRVADMLNLMGHGKAEYLTKAVLFYEENQKCVVSAKTIVNNGDIENIVRKVLAEQKPFGMDSTFQADKISGIEKENFGESDMQNVLLALDSFRR